MKKNTSLKPLPSGSFVIIGAVVLFAAIIALIFSVVVLSRDISMLKNEVRFLDKQSLQFNGRTNNLEGCWKNQDFECPENKYFNASQFMTDEN